jgi:hypothetical protein
MGTPPFEASGVTSHEALAFDTVRRREPERRLSLLLRLDQKDSLQGVMTRESRQGSFW